MLEIIITIVVSAAVTAVVTALVVSNYHKKTTEATIGNAQDKAREIIDEALKDAESKKREALLEAKDEIFKLRSKAEDEAKARRNELNQLEQRLLQKEDALDKKLEGIERKEAHLQKEKWRAGCAAGEDYQSGAGATGGVGAYFWADLRAGQGKLLNDVNKEVQVDSGYND